MSKWFERIEIRDCYIHNHTESHMCKYIIMIFIIILKFTTTAVCGAICCVVCGTICCVVCGTNLLCGVWHESAVCVCGDLMHMFCQV